MSLRFIPLIIAFGAGVLISAVAFDLVEEATGKSSATMQGTGERDPVDIAVEPLRWSP